MIGKTNVNGTNDASGVGAVLSIDVPTGATVTVSQESFSKILKDSIEIDELHSRYFYLISPNKFGSWTITASLEGRTESNTIVIALAQQYDISLTIPPANAIYWYGGQFTSITGGWEAYVSGNGQANTGITTFLNNYIYFTSNMVSGSHFAYGAFGTVNKIDLTNYSYLKVLANTTGTDYENLYMAVGVDSSWHYQPVTAYFDDAITTLEVGELQTTTLNIQTITGEKWICIGASEGSKTSTVTSKIYGIWLE